MTAADIAISALAATVMFWSSHAMAAEAPAAPTTAIGIAVFPFELEDFGAAAKTGQDVPLAQATEEATQQLLQSGRYRPIDATHAELGPAKQQGLRNCGGCEAAIAKQLGADQALVGVITRISMTEYVVRIQVSDAHAGNVVARFSTDLPWARIIPGRGASAG